MARGVGLAVLLAACAPSGMRDTLAFTQAAPARPAPTAPRPADVACAADAGWNDPAPPRRVHGDTWYVGTCGITALLIAGPEGHVLIDTGTDLGAHLVEANIRALGLRVEDVRLIVTSHAHNDHVGGIALLQRDTRATVVARAPALAALRDGRGDRRDPQYLVADGFPPVADDTMRPVDDGAVLRLGPIRLTAHATPGHTPGGTSWSWTSCGPAGASEPAGCLAMVYADSVTPISDDAYRYGDPSPAGARALAAQRRGLEALAGLPCDVLLTPHPGASRLWERLGPGAHRPLVDANACRDYARRGERLLDARLALERSGMTPGDGLRVPTLPADATP